MAVPVMDKLMNSRKSTMRLFHQIVIDRSVPDVFDFVSTTKNITKWKKGLVEVRRKTAETTGVGTVDTHISEFMGTRSEIDHQITRYEPPHLVEFVTLNAPFPSRGYFHFEAEQDSTKVTVVSQAEPNHIYKYLAPLMQWIAMQQLKRDLSNLKQVMES
jgi:uncharacterized protein YndB with AHSA1/START domain